MFLPLSISLQNYLFRLRIRVFSSLQGLASMRSQILLLWVMYLDTLFYIVIMLWLYGQKSNFNLPSSCIPFSTSWTFWERVTSFFSYIGKMGITWNSWTIVNSYLCGSIFSYWMLNVFSLRMFISVSLGNAWAIFIFLPPSDDSYYGFLELNFNINSII
jgi:hypothetical protein